MASRASMASSTLMLVSSRTLLRLQRGMGQGEGGRAAAAEAVNRQPLQ